MKSARTKRTLCLIAFLMDASIVRNDIICHSCFMSFVVVLQGVIWLLANLQ